MLNERRMIQLTETVPEDIMELGDLQFRWQQGFSTYSNHKAELSGLAPYLIDADG